MIGRFNPADETELRRIEAFAAEFAEDAAYTKQYFTIGQQAHVRATQSFGTPSLVWHVAFWPKRRKDPQDLSDSVAGVGTRKRARKSYERMRAQLARDINEHVLKKLQRKGRIDGLEELFAMPAAPPDWEPEDVRRETPVDALPTESIAFTVWWHDEERAECPSSPEGPPEADLRVRVQADIHPDFAAVTFIIDAGKPWDAAPFSVGSHAPEHGEEDAGKDEGEIALVRETEVPWPGEPERKPWCPLAGKRRRKIFRAARIIGHMASERLKSDPEGRQELLPETGVLPEQARRLRWASRLLYLDIWSEFCAYFDCSLTDIAGDTDKVFANFRGVVLSAPGKEPEPGEPRPHLSRFVYGGRSERDALDQPHPNGVVKAYWPFIRRTRSEADYRDWIACGVFDWRALYITALGGQSELDPNDEGKPATDVPAANLPQHKRVSRQQMRDIEVNLGRLRSLKKAHAGDPDTLRRIEETEHRLRFPVTPRGDRPRPFHYLFLTAGEPDRRQAGRMVDRVNLLGTVRLYAMKNFSIIRDADVHLRIYGQLLDQIMSTATKSINDDLKRWWSEAYDDARLKLLDLSRKRHELRRALKKDAAARLYGDFITCIHCLKLERRRLAAGRNVTERALLLYRRLLFDVGKAGRDLRVAGAVGSAAASDSIFSCARNLLGEARTAKSRHDEDMAQLNRQTDLQLQEIKTHIDELGRDAIGGLPFRINRARFYADMYRTLVKTLRVGSIDTWWDYGQLASRAVDPPLKFIENVGDRLEKLRTRLRDAMDAVQTGAIANQTEATRDNTYQLEVIALETARVAQAAEAAQGLLRTLQLENERQQSELLRMQQENESQRSKVLRIQKAVSRLEFLVALVSVSGLGAWLWNGGLDLIVSWFKILLPG